MPSWVGHLNPMTTLGRELQRRGHRVTVLSFPESAERAQRAGLDLRRIGTGPFPLGEWERRTRILSRASGFSASRITIRWIGDIAGVMLNELPEVLKSGGYDGVLVDQVCFGGACAADECNLPLVIVCNALPVHLQPDVPVHTETWPYRTDWFSLLRNRLLQGLLVQIARPFIGPVRKRREARGHPWDAMRYLNEIPPSLAQIAQLPACLDFPRRHAPDHFHHTGPWHEPKAADPGGFDGSWLDGRPLIYASLGTLQNGLDHLYQTILDAVADLPVQGVLTLGRENGVRPARIPSNCQVLGFGPQLALLQRASMVITHAGLNTTLESLAQGLPMVALPIANEQPGIAARVRHVGAGELLKIGGLKPGTLRKTVETVLNDPKYRQNAQGCARAMATVNGLRRAAEIVEEAVTHRRRVLRTPGPGETHP